MMIWVVVELETNVGYDSEESGYEYKTIGAVYGPYLTPEDGAVVAKGLAKRNKYSEFEVKQVIP